MTHKNVEYTDSYFVEFIDSGFYTYSTKGHSSVAEPWTVRTEYPYYHMNWGGGGGSDGWFFNNSVTPKDHNWQYFRENYYAHP